MVIIKVKLPAKNNSYNILISSNILKRIGSIVKNLNIGNDIFIITDCKVGKLYTSRVITSLRSAGFISIGEFRIQDGESEKVLHTYERILEKLYDFDKYQDKKIVIITLGGGVVGDIGGFVAGTYRRGINYVQIPTTLLSQVDSGLGGKVGVNFEAAKNLVGLFYQPKSVCMDISLLKTLNKIEMKSGLAEIIKYGVIKDKNLFEYLERHLNQILHYNPVCLKHVVLTCVRIKSKITEKDEKDEKDIRIILNFGHTIGHAIEAASKYKIYTHGEAISIGMLCAAEIACKLGLFKHKDFLRLENLIKRAGLPIKIKGCSIKDIFDSMKHDKKFVGGRNRFILPVNIGVVKIEENINKNLIKNIIAKRMAKVEKK